MLSLFELANCPFWRKHNGWDRVFDSVLAAAAAATLVAVGWLLTTRARTPSVAATRT